MVGIGEGTDDSERFCPGCGRAELACVGSCGRSAPGATPRFCRRCGWRLREIAVVPGVGSRWCRTHGVLDE